MRPPTRLSVIFILALIFAVAAAACGGGDDSGEEDSVAAEPTAAAPESTPTTSDPGGASSSIALEVGDCFDDPAAGTGLPLDTADIEPVDCDEPHDNEVYLVEEYAGDGAHPGAAVLEDAATELCAGSFADYVGIAFEDSRYFSFFLVPSEASWAVGDRAILCSLFDPAEQLVGSAEGSAE